MTHWRHFLRKVLYSGLNFILLFRYQRHGCAAGTGACRMIYFYFPYLFLVRRVLWLFVSLCLLLSAWCWYQWPSCGVLVLASADMLSPKSVPVINWRQKIEVCAQQAQCHVRAAGHTITVIGSKGKIIHCAWLCSLHAIPISLYSLKPCGFSGRYSWKIVV